MKLFGIGCECSMSRSASFSEPAVLCSCFYVSFSDILLLFSHMLTVLFYQVVQAVDLSNQRLLGQMQSLFTQIRLQLQVQILNSEFDCNALIIYVEADLMGLIEHLFCNTTLTCRIPGY